MLAYGLDRAAWYEGSQLSASIAIDDEERYRSEVFPHLWSLGRIRPVKATPDGVVIISTTGPTGMALLALHLGPR